MLTNSIKTYLSVRRALGFKLQSVEKYLLCGRSLFPETGDRIITEEVRKFPIGK